MLRLNSEFEITTHVYLFSSRWPALLIAFKIQNNPTPISNGFIKPEILGRKVRLNKIMISHWPVNNIYLKLVKSIEL